MTSEDERFMRRALSLARRGLGRTSPNPMVGAVLVRDGRVIGEGYHRRFGGPHAEIEAIADAGGDTSGATLFVTLEPCCHLGKKTPPCLDTLLRHDLRRVVIGTIDPNPAVSGRSAKALRDHGIETATGVLEKECRRLNEVYFKYIRTRMPFVTIKYAATLDGRIATAASASRWISSPASLKLAHRLRSLHDAVLVGAGTILADDPRLTVRLVRGRSPVRFVLDSRLRIPVDARVLDEQETAKTLIVSTPGADAEKAAQLAGRGLELMTVREDQAGLVHLDDMLRKAGEKGISSVLVEGGATVITSFIRRGLADRFVVILAPKILGKGIEAVHDLGILEVRDALGLTFTGVRRSGEDIVIEARPATGGAHRSPGSS
ncbi:MAG: bifunctional diaminohydroxyphosphoribosylaminopyrimidine deaminase/5-amino-6-(5-phosphoribosylamino)uracil reductase RibD [Dehalococcoidia bacterium]|nr:bifunctional diaminohydroxyphosphoribosylaminopyrimidine deaminase/5-amino-6-(5-phosphoribosylamino)uracil reductase RibD [Dehalococcoidia bacterium]